MKILFAIGFVAILGALGAAGFFMLRDGRAGRSRAGNMMRALALRVALSVALFLIVIFAFWMGWIEPTGIPLGR